MASIVLLPTVACEAYLERPSVGLATIATTYGRSEAPLACSSLSLRQQLLVVSSEAVAAAAARSQSSMVHQPRDNMSKLQILRTAVKRPNSGKKYVETYNFVAFHSRINLRRKMKRKGCRFGALLDLEKDFKQELEQYQGPTMEAGQPLTQELLDQLQNFFVHQEAGRLHRKYVYRILCMAETAYRTDPSLLVDICVPPEAVINICGDIHGQLYDLIKILKLQGN